MIFSISAIIRRALAASGFSGSRSRNFSKFVFADVFNLPGNKEVNAGLNPGDIRYSSAANSSVGTRALSCVSGKIVLVTRLRTFKISARITF